MLAAKLSPSHLFQWFYGGQEIASREVNNIFCFSVNLNIVTIEQRCAANCWLKTTETVVLSLCCLIHPVRPVHAPSYSVEPTSRRPCWLIFPDVEQVR